MTKRLRERRTAFITAGGIAAVIVAGAFAVGANIGILDASSDNQIGALAAAGDLATTTGPTLAPVTTIPAAPTAATTQTYLVDVAGTVAVDATGDALVVSTVVPTAGWTWKTGPADTAHVQLTFSDGVRSLVFTATRAPDGSINASVADVTSGAVSASTATAVPPFHQAADDREGHGDGHEGRDDDD